MMENIVGKLFAAFGVFATLMALWVPGGEFWKWFWSGVILLVVSLFVTAWHKARLEDDARGR